MYAKVGYLPDPYRLPVGVGDGQAIGAVEKIVMNESDPDRLGPYIRRALREEFVAKLRVADSEGQEVTEC